MRLWQGQEPSLASVSPSVKRDELSLLPRVCEEEMGKQRLAGSREVDSHAKQKLPCDFGQVASH